MLSDPESTSVTWRLSVKSAPAKPKFITVGFETAKDGDQTKTSSTFDDVTLKIAYITLKSDRYHAIDYNFSFFNQIFSRVYGDAALFSFKFVGVAKLIKKSNIVPSD